MPNDLTTIPDRIEDPLESAERDPEADLTLARQGDPQAFSRLASSHETRLFQQAVALCGNPSIAEDLAAETFIAAWKCLPRFRGGCRFSTWLYGILLHRFHKHVRRQRARPPSQDALQPSTVAEGEDRLVRIPAPEPEAAEWTARREIQGQLRQALTQLSPAHQAVLLLRFFEGAQLPEIAAALRIPLGTAKSRLHHALEHLRKRPIVVNLLRSREDLRL